ncbi:plasma membrane-type Ca(2+)-ATPase A1 PMCAA1 [Besnoitia besnoiti]|uniref:P-type Cu(+) transporter n=1 Tax=Besnoitia besnoiti TaxID=94643 RepID=A0A2A9MES2_BESBE|nr:plasma membrane-type Ca(2+)-ATPase A1 PMCAA1 [Besnoitia besnoiti]PFH34173.1 plasma membrane-type Ca(2+)-ATPase A1 PMCAA1 [Besnoitia besnoiti]
MEELKKQAADLPRLFRDRWATGLGDYCSQRPLLVAGFLLLTLAQVFVTFWFLKLFPAPVLLTWWQLTSSLLCAYILGEFGDAFHKFRYFPRLGAPDKDTFVRFLPYSLSYCLFLVFSNALVAHLPNPIYLPLAAAFAVGTNQIFRFCGCSAIQDASPLRWVSTCLLVLPPFVCCAVWGSSFIVYVILSAFSTILFRSCFLPKALHLAGGHGSELNFYHNLTGAAVLLLPAWFLGELSPALSFSFLLQWRNWQIGGCWVTVSVLAFLRNVVGNRVMREGGAEVWRATEIVALVLVGCLSPFLVEPVPGFAVVVSYVCVLSGRLLGNLEGLAEEEKRSQFHRALIHGGSSICPGGKDKHLTDEPVLFVHSDGPATSFAQGSPSDVWPDDEDPEAYRERRMRLTDIVHAYVTRVNHEDIDLIQDLGGVQTICHGLGSDLCDGLAIVKGLTSRARGSFDSTSTGSPRFRSSLFSRDGRGNWRLLGSGAFGAGSSSDALVHGQSARGSEQEEDGGILAAASRQSWLGGLLGLGSKAPEDGDLLRTQQRRYGVNRLPHRPLSSFWTLVLEAASDATLRILMVCGLLSIVLALLFSSEPEIEMLEGVAIWVAVLVVVIVTAGNDWMKEQQFAQLSVVKDDKRCTVIRNGRKEQISVFQLVVGDLIHLEAGDEIPADAIVTQSNELKVDESSLTGESDMIRKEAFKRCLEEAAVADRKSAARGTPKCAREEEARAGSPVPPLQLDEAKATSPAGTSRSGGPAPPWHDTEAASHHEVASPVVLSGTTISTGSGTALVIAVGHYSQVGQMFQKLAYDAEPTPLQRKLNALAEDIGNFGLISAILAFFVLLAEFWVMFFLQDSAKRESALDVINDHVEFFVTAITMLVVAVPEGLPLAVTISLAYSIGQMLRDQNYVRRLAACEIMGGANEICSDKTGTLTKNQMTVTQFWNGQSILQVPSFSAASAEGSADSTSPRAFREILGDGNEHEASTTLASLPPSADSVTAASSVPSHPANVAGAGGSANDQEALACLQHHDLKWEILMQAIALNSTAFLVSEEVLIAEGTEEESKRVTLKHIGSPTECALLAFQDQPCGGDYAATRRQLLGEGETQLVQREDFSSDRKMMTSVVRIPRSSAGGADDASGSRDILRIFVKGAGERVLQQCTSLMVANGEIERLTPDRKAEIEKTVINTMASQALRTICLAYRDIDPELEPDWKERCAPPQQFFLKAETNLTCLGIAGIEDPVRDEVPGAVSQCQRAGIKVRMVTGDNIITAKAIAKRCHIYHEDAGGIAMLGPDFTRAVGGVVCQSCQTEICGCATDAKTAEEQNLPLRVDVIRDLEAFDKIWSRLEVLARSQPSDKYALVTALKQKGRVVAVTGDGTNDAPALKKADVGFAMGLSGKEVAKQAADIVMLDDNFTCIVKAVKWGRNIYDNIRRFLQFQLTVNAVAVVLTVVCAAVEREAPLSAVQMLWVNLIMDSFASLALATERPTEDLLNRKPQGRDSYLISRSMLTSIVASAVYQLTVMLSLIFYGEHFLPETKWGFLSDEERTNLGFCEFSDCNTTTFTGTRMLSGRRYKLFSTEDDYKPEWLREVGPSRHGTFVFNTFVFMQIFNMVNARDVDDSQIDKGTSLLGSIVMMVKNPLGLGIWLFILFGQILMTEYGGRLLGCNVEGLNGEQWLLSLLIAVGGLLWGRLPRIFPGLYKLAPELGSREETLEDTRSIALELRGRTPDRINERLGLASYTFAKKYAKKARLMTLSRLRRRNLQSRAGGGSRSISPPSSATRRGENESAWRQRTTSVASPGADPCQGGSALIELPVSSL